MDTKCKGATELKAFMSKIQLITLSFGHSDFRIGSI